MNYFLLYRILFCLSSLIYLHEARVKAAGGLFIISLGSASFTVFDILKLILLALFLIKPINSFHQIGRIAGYNAQKLFLLFLLSSFASIILSYLSTQDLLISRLREFAPIFVIPAYFLLSSYLSRISWHRFVRFTLTIIAIYTIAVYIFSSISPLEASFSLWPGQFAIVFLFYDSKLLKEILLKEPRVHKGSYLEPSFPSFKLSKKHILYCTRPLLLMFALLLYPQKPVLGSFVFSIILYLFIFIKARKPKPHVVVTCTIVPAMIIVLTTCYLLSTSFEFREFVMVKILKLPIVPDSINIDLFLEYFGALLSGDLSAYTYSDLSGGRFDLLKDFLAESRPISFTLGTIPDFSTRNHLYIIHPHNSFAYLSYALGYISSISFYAFNFLMITKAIKLVLESSSSFRIKYLSVLMFSTSTMFTELYSGVFLNTSWMNILSLSILVHILSNAAPKTTHLKQSYLPIQ